MKTISTCYTVDNIKSSESYGVSNYECAEIKPLISISGIDILFDLNLSDIKALAGTIGCTTGGLSLSHSKKTYSS